MGDRDHIWLDFGKKDLNWIEINLIVTRPGSGGRDFSAHMLPGHFSRLLNYARLGIDVTGIVMGVFFQMLDSTSIMQENPPASCGITDVQKTKIKTLLGACLVSNPGLLFILQSDLMSDWYWYQLLFKAEISGLYQKWKYNIALFPNVFIVKHEKGYLGIPCVVDIK